MAICRMEPSEIGMLAVIAQYNIAITAKTYSANFPVTEEEAGELFWSLKSRGYLDEVDLNTYRISDHGRAILDEEFGVAECGDGPS